MEPNPQSHQTSVLEDQNNRGKAIMPMSSDEEELNNREIVVISDDETEGEENEEGTPMPVRERGETSQTRVNTPRVSRPRWTLLEDWKLVELVSIHEQSMILWKSIAEEIPSRSSDSCRVRWSKLWRSDDKFTEERWSELEGFLSISREDLTNRWSQRILSRTAHLYASTSSVNVGSMITNNSLAQVQEPIMGGDDNGETSTTVVAVPTSPGSTSPFPSLDLNISLEPNHNQTPSPPPTSPARPFYNFLGVDSD